MSTASTRSGRPYELPSERDFDPLPSHLDAQAAWKNFGGLHLDEAHAKFCENPLSYQEDFMFMGAVAFEFYFPVLDRYLRETCGHGAGDESVVGILAHGIEMQFLVDGASVAPELRRRVLKLCAHVRAHLAQYAETEAERAPIEEAWRHLQEVAESADRAHGARDRA